ncbi:allophanate hydrolase subunit 1 [Robertmurraya massiliosenegalensis]|uniref:5-oxoprolinase subunit B family protein n=1 Tax=Robertmurraya TaxID=2837507 RepID=UPI0039A7715E
MEVLDKTVTYTVRRMGERIITLTYPQEISNEIRFQIKYYHDLFHTIPLTGVLQVIPAMNTISIRYNPLIITESEILDFIENHPPRKEENHAMTSRRVYVPIVFGDEYSLDLNEIANKCGLSRDRVVEKMIDRDFYVYLTGFIAGTPYIGEIDADIALPRRAMPRLKVSEGSIAIANNMCTIYTIESPGGWNIIGWTPMKLFNAFKSIPNTANMGDCIHFKRITPEEAKHWDDNRQEKWDHQWNQ